MFTKEQMEYLDQMFMEREQQITAEVKRHLFDKLEEAANAAYCARVQASMIEAAACDPALNLPDDFKAFTAMTVTMCENVREKIDECY